MDSLKEKMNENYTLIGGVRIGRANATYPPISVSFERNLIE